MVRSTLVLVHSPLVGPSSWRPFDDVARARGVDVVRPDLTGVVDAEPPQWRYLVDAAVDSASDRPELVVVGHSGAGAFLPAIAHRVKDRLRAVVFVDAIVPPSAGEHRTSEQLSKFLDDKTVDGRLLPWFDWWPPTVVDTLVSSPEQLEELRSDMPRLHRSFYNAHIPMPEGWSSGPCVYLQLSPAYDEESRIATELGWPTAFLDGSHLSIFTDPIAVLAAVEDLVDRVDLTPSPDLA